MAKGAIGRLGARLKEETDAFLVTTATNRRYLTGFASTAGLVLITRAGGWFLTDFRYFEAAQARIKNATCLLQQGIDPLPELLKEQGSRRVVVEASGMTLAAFARFKEQIPFVEWAGDGSLDDAIDSLREVKTPEEQEGIRRAQQLTDDGFAYILTKLRPGMTEKQVAVELAYRLQSQGADGMAFDPIVVSGTRSSLPHGVPSDKPLETGDLVTMDFGALLDGWHADMTRTVAIGRADARQKEVYDTVLKAQQAALSTLCAGALCRTADAAARQVIAAAGFGDYFGHSTGHGVGLAIHEGPHLSSSAGEKRLKTGHVVTVEPGIYLPGTFGVRIEDLAIIGPEGCENLTRSPKELLVV